LEDPATNPRDIKRALARIFVEMYHSEDDAKRAEEEFDKIFINKGIPDDISELVVDENEIDIIDLIIKADFSPSRGEARRLITQGGVSIDGEKITDPKSLVKVESGNVLKVGKRKFIKIIGK